MRIRSINWIWALGVGAAVHFVVLGFIAFVNQETFQIERSSGPVMSVIGSQEMFSEVLGNNEVDSKEVSGEDVTEEVSEVTEPVEFETKPVDEIKETSVDQTVAVYASEKKPEEAEEVKEVKEQPKEVEKKKKPKKKKKKKRSKASKKGGRQTASARKGGGSSGRQSNVSGKASITNYRGKVRSRVARRKKRLGSSRGTAVVTFSITRSGGVSGLRLSRRSGNSAVDRAALAMVRGAAPFPRIPAGLKAPMRFRLPISFK